MHYEQDVFTTQFPIAKRFVYHLAYYKTLISAYQTHGLQSEFWVTTIDAHLLQATILWCNVFGSDGSSRIHWKRLSKVDSNKLQASFRKGLPQWIGLGWPQWQAYWKEMTGFRNQYAAHREQYEYKKKVPNYDTALRVIDYYDNWIRKVISPDILEEPPLTATYERLSTENAPLIEQLLETTKALRGNASLAANK